MASGASLMLYHRATGPETLPTLRQATYQGHPLLSLTDPEHNLPKRMHIRYAEGKKETAEAQLFCSSPAVCLPS